MLEQATCPHALSGDDVRRKCDGGGLQPSQLMHVRGDARLSTLLEPSVPLTLALLAETAVHRDVSGFRGHPCFLQHVVGGYIDALSCVAQHVVDGWYAEVIYEDALSWGMTLLEDSACYSGSFLRC
jgi:hypothetical protein